MRSTNVVVEEGRDYSRDSFTIHTEQRVNGWGFRIRSETFYMIYCMGGFALEDHALAHASMYCDFIEQTLDANAMRTKDSLPEPLVALPEAARKRA